MKILTFSTLFPNAARPTHGIFVETRLRQLVASGDVEARVVAPVPWFPFTGERFGEYGAHARAPHEETRHGIEVQHPRYPVVPKVGMTLAPFLLYRAVLPTVQRLLERYPFELIDAHYFYPDGVAAAMLGQRLGKPVVITARGTDLTLIPGFRLPRKLISWAATRAAGLVTVSQSLKRELVAIGIAPERVEVMRNGVNLELFRPLESRAALRRELALTAPTLLSVGHLIPRKSHDLVIRALAQLDGFELVVIGSGPERAALHGLAKDLGLARRVRFVEALAQDALARYYAAADALVLASSREGWANVLLESMACGTPVVATDVGGAAEVVRSHEAGLLVGERSAPALARAIRDLFARYPARAATRAYAERHGWEPTTRAQLDLFARLLGMPARRAARDAAVSVAGT